MDSQAIRQFFNEHSDGVQITMIDGTVYRLPHRDYLWLTPAFGKDAQRIGRLATYFWLHDPDTDETKLVNSMLVKELAPWKGNGKGRGKHTKKSA